MSAAVQLCTASAQGRSAGQAERVRAVVSPVAPQTSVVFASGQARRNLQQHVRHGPVLVAASSAPAVAEPPPAAESWKPSNPELKAALLDSLFGTERGLSANSELRAEINELITQLEAGSPYAAPNEVTDLNGEWKLVYTSNSELTALLALSRLPFVTVGDITQTIDGPSLTVINKVQLTVPFSRTAFSSKASFEVRSPKLLNIKFEQGTVQTPELLQDVEIPESVTVLGQSIDLTTLKAALQPVTTSLRSAVEQAARFVSQQPDLQFPIKSDRAQSWLLTTYLDEDTRIARGDGGSVFVMVKEVSLSTAPAFEAAALGTNADIAFGATPAMNVSASTAASGGSVPKKVELDATSASGYADEVTPDVPTTTDPTLAGDYVDEVTSDALTSSTSSSSTSSAEVVITPGASAPDTIVPPDYTTDVSTRGEY